MSAMGIPKERHLQGHSNRNSHVNKAIMLNVPSAVLMKMYNWRDTNMINDYLRAVYKAESGAPKTISKMPIHEREALIEHIF